MMTTAKVPPLHVAEVQRLEVGCISATTLAQGWLRLPTNTRAAIRQLLEHFSSIPTRLTRGKERTVGLHKDPITRLHCRCGSKIWRIIRLRLWKQNWLGLSRIRHNDGEVRVLVQVVMLHVRRLAVTSVRLLKLIRAAICKPIVQIYGHRRKRTWRPIFHEVDDGVRRRRRRLGVGVTVRRKRRCRGVADGVHIIQRRIRHD